MAKLQVLLSYYIEKNVCPWSLLESYPREQTRVVTNSFNVAGILSWDFAFSEQEDEALNFLTCQFLKNSIKESITIFLKILKVRAKLIFF
jgi:hypothetical protein